MYEKIIKKYNVISFDVFDTLITRNLDNPTELFNFVQKRFSNISDFKKRRIEAEKKALEMNDSEITFEEIYKEFKNMNADINIDTIEEIKKTELEFEINICEINNSFYDIYRYCMKENKKILIISDMYLPQDTIKKILKNNNIEYDKLYVSSEYKKCKRDGSLYKYIQSDLNIDKKSWLHFGDNYRSDIIIPKLLGIRTIQVKYNKNNIIANKKIKDTNYVFLKNFLNNHYKMEKGYFYNIGYQILGILLYSYIKWLEEKILYNKYDKVFFLARDGKIMQKTMNIINENINSEYMYASRRALIVPTLWKCKDLDEVVNSMMFEKNITIKSFFKKIGMDDDELLQNECEKYNYNLTDYINIYDEKEKKAFIELYEGLKEKIRNNSKKEYDELIKYLEYINFKNNIAIVDIGWFGDMQKSLNKICDYAKLNANIHGYYIGVVPNSKIQDEYDMNGFLFEKEKNQELYYDEKMFNAIFEIFFSTNHGSVKKIENCEPKFSKYEYENCETEKFLLEIQNGAIDFVKDFKKYSFSKNIDINNVISFSNFKEFGVNPRKCDIINFKDIVFYDSEYIKLIEEANFIFHPIKFIKLFKKSIWKIGFLKKNLSFKINYYKIVKLIRG